jgi:PhnB protein
MAERIPPDYGSVTPFLVVNGVREFIEFLKAAFGAVDRGQIPAGDGLIAHAEAKIGDTVLMMFDRRQGWPPTPAFLMHYVEDADATHESALAAGCIEVTSISTNAWGDRGSRVRDPFGNIWWIQSHVEDVPEDEMMRRMGEVGQQALAAESTETLDAAMRGIR